MPEILFLIILIIIVVVLILYNLYIKKNFKTVEKSRKRLDDLSVLNDLVKITGSLKPVNEKLNNINDILIQKYSIDYSSIIIFDGKSFVAKASNLDKKNKAFIEKIYTNPIFAESIQTKEAKYITVENPTDNLSYLEEEKARAKTAVFFPLYIEAVFVGFWLIESRINKGFQNLDMQIMMEVKSRILDIIRTMSYQTSMENMVKDDLFSELKTYEYLMTQGKIELEAFNESTVMMYRIANIEYINEKFSRHAGNMTITNVTKAIEHVLKEEKLSNVFVRYSGPKFAVAFPGKLPEELSSVFERIHIAGECLLLLESEVEQVQRDEVESFDTLVDLIDDKDNKTEDKKKNKKTEKEKEDEDNEIQARLNIVAAKYYRGTGLEMLCKELEDFLEETNEETSITIL